MAKLYISEYSARGFVRGDAPTGAVQSSSVEVALEPSIDQVVTFSTETKSATLNKNTQLIRIHADAKCSIVVGTSPTATTNSKKMVADQTEYFSVPRNSGYKVSVISNNT